MGSHWIQETAKPCFQCQWEDPLGRANLGGMLCSRLSVVMTEHQNKSTWRRKSLFWLTVLEISVLGQLTRLFSDLWQRGIMPHLMAPRKEKETDTKRQMCYTLLNISARFLLFSKWYLVSLCSKIPDDRGRAVPSLMSHLITMTLSYTRPYLFQLPPERGHTIYLGQGHDIMRWLLDHILWSPSCQMDIYKHMYTHTTLFQPRKYN